MSCPVWELGTDLKSSRRVMCAPNLKLSLYLPFGSFFFFFESCVHTSSMCNSSGDPQMQLKGLKNMQLYSKCTTFSYFHLKYK